MASPGLMSLSGMFCLASAAFDVGRGDLLADVHHSALQRDHVDQMRAGEQRLEFFDAKLLQAVGVADLRCGETIVEPHLVLVAVAAQLDSDMAEAVELRAGLADLRGQEFVVIDHLVVAERAAGRAAGNTQRERARTEQRHAAFVDAADLVDLAVLDPFRGVEDLFGRDVI